MGKSKLNEGNAIRPENAAQIYKVLDELESAREQWSQQRCAEKELAYYNECMELFVELIIVLGSTPPASDAERANRDLLAEAFDGIRIASKVFLWRYYGQAFTILRRVEEIVLIIENLFRDTKVGKRWLEGVKITPGNLREAVKGRIDGIAPEVDAQIRRRLYDTYCEVSHPNREGIPNRHLGEPNRTSFEPKQGDETKLRLCMQELGTSAVYLLALAHNVWKKTIQDSCRPEWKEAVSQVFNGISALEDWRKETLDG